MTGYQNRPLTDYPVDPTHVAEVVPTITTWFNAKMEACNKNPKFKHPVLSKEGYFPAYRPFKYGTGSPPTLFQGRFNWCAHFEPAHEKSTTCFEISYYPNPKKYLEFLSSDIRPELAEEMKMNWQKANSAIDLTKELFQSSLEFDLRKERGHPTKHIDHTPQRGMQAIERNLELIAQSRITGKWPFYA